MSARKSAAEVVWSLYPPLALMAAAALLFAGGCASSREGDEADAYAAEEPAAIVASAAASAPVYPAHLPVAGTAAARATALHGRDQLDLVNLGRHDWASGRVWLNGRYGAALPPRTAPGAIRRLPFALFRDADGLPFPSDNAAVVVDRVELQFGDELARVRFGLGT